MLSLVVFMHRDVNMVRKGKKKKRFSHNLWTLSSEQSAYSVSCKGHLFQWPLCSGCTTIKASPQKPWPTSSSTVLYVTNKPTVKAPCSKVQRGQAATKKLFDTLVKIWAIALYRNSEHHWACTSKCDELHNPDIKTALWKACGEFIQNQMMKCFLNYSNTHTLRPHSTEPCAFFSHGYATITVLQIFFHHVASCYVTAVAFAWTYLALWWHLALRWCSPHHLCGRGWPLGSPLLCLCTLCWGPDLKTFKNKSLTVTAPHPSRHWSVLFNILKVHSCWES